MGFSITLKPIDSKDPVIALGCGAKVVHIESGVDISASVQEIDISLKPDEWATVKLTCDIAELKLDGLILEEVLCSRSKVCKLNECRIIREE